MWLRVLRGLDSALIALHIIACPDVSRGRLLAMEELVDAIITITQFHFQRLVTVITTPPGGEGKRCALDLTNRLRESVGSRLSEALCGLATLVRLHPGRFSDTLMMHLADLGIFVMSCGVGHLCASSAASSASASNPACVIFPETAPPSTPMEAYYKRNSWRLQIQRSALAITSTIFLQYEKLRQLFATDIITQLILPPQKPGSSKVVASACFGRNFW